MDLESFTKNAKYFDLGHLPTEGFHPSTQQLSDLIQLDLAEAIRTVQRIDVQAMQALELVQPDLTELEREIIETHRRGKRVFLTGCGATGRLALALEATWRKVHEQSPERQAAVQALMAGGDFALVKSVENFEDFPEYGERHLFDLGFQEGDLLIAITEGGETPYVIGTVHAALKRSSRSPWFVYCNPTDLLCKTIERSRAVIEDPRVRALCLDTGPMALSGSTRLQAATVQMLAVGAALFRQLDQVRHFIQEYARIDLAPFIQPVTEWESEIYKKQEFTLYRTSTYPIAVLTDTTERSPTFSLTPFEKREEVRDLYSWCYLSIPGAEDARSSWKRILGRDPIGLAWPELQGRLDVDSILGFDFSEAVSEIRAKKLPGRQHWLQMDAHPETQVLEFIADGLIDVKLSTDLMLNPLWEQLLVKMILNIHSLMVMGLMQRFEGNVMTWVRPSNGKLIDRTARYLEFLIKKRGLRPIRREALVQRIFETQALIQPDEAVILKILLDLSRA